MAEAGSCVEEQGAEMDQRVQQEVQQRIQEREKELQQAVEAITRSAQTAEQTSERIFTELIASIETRRSEVKDQIRSSYWNTVRQSYQSLSSPSVSPLPSIIAPDQFFSGVTDSVSELRDEVENILNTERPNISTTEPQKKRKKQSSLPPPEPQTRAVLPRDVSLRPPEPQTRAVLPQDVSLRPPEPQTREDFLQYHRQLSLDPNTANRFLSLSERNRKVTWVDEDQGYPHHPERFTGLQQVLSSEALSDRSYWEVQWSGLGVRTAVSYKDISRTGIDSGLGHNNKSWSLLCSINSDNVYRFSHNAVSTPVPGVCPVSSRLGVYLDHSAGSLSFYSVSDPMTMKRLHRVQVQFDKDLYAGFEVFGSAELV